MPRCLTPAEVVAEARTWIGTPAVPQAGVRGIGADCGGIHRGLLRTWGITLTFPDEHVATLRAMDWYLHTRREWFYEAFVLSELMEEVPVAQRQLSDTLLLGFGRNPASHATLLSQIAPQEMVLHTDPRRGIVEVPLAPYAQRIRWVFRLNYAAIAERMQEEVPQ